MIFSKKSKYKDLKVTLDDGDYPVKIRVNLRAKRIILRYDIETGGAKVTVPKGTSFRKIEAFIRDHRGWIMDQRQSQSLTKLFNGDTVSVNGRAVRILYSDKPPRRIQIHLSGNGTVCEVGGPIAHAPKRLENWLKKQAREQLSEKALVHATALDLEFNRLSIGDMSSRWGSCSSAGTLKFNWRLVMAPPEILDYVAAHEVAHLGEMNHSPAFWNLVEKQVPKWQLHRKWLKQQGGDLMKIRFAVKA